jgi:molecular chaperone GrpE
VSDENKPDSEQPEESMNDQANQPEGCEENVVEMAAEAEADVAVLQQELETARDQVLRTQAEMQNLRRRVERDVENAHKFGLEKLVGELLPVVDNLERAIAAMDADAGDHGAITEGVTLTLKSFQDVLGRFKVEAVEPHGAPFDPELHQAMSMVPSPDVEPNTVIEVFQKGYTLHGRLVRPAMVVVAKAP